MGFSGRKLGLQESKDLQRGAEMFAKQQGSRCGPKHACLPTAQCLYATHLHGGAQVRLARAVRHLHPPAMQAPSLSSTSCGYGDS